MAEAFDRLKAALADRYAIVRELGAGGMATVYLAEDLKHHRQVAIKVLRPELAASLGAERFVREIEIAAQLAHPHILPLFDSGEADGFLYYVMPFIKGESLREQLDREGKLEIRETIRLTDQIASALSHAHELGLVHRDIKPENILLAGDQAIVADFGIARAVEMAGGERLTGTGLAVGTPEYMSPEQAFGDSNVDGRSDVYALGCVVYEMVSGHAPFEANTPQALLAKHAADTAPSLRTSDPSIPLFLERAVARALAKTPADRFQSANAFAEALTGEMVVARVGRRRWRAQAVGAATVVIVVVTAWILATLTADGVQTQKRIAVLPFENLSGAEDEYFSEGITRDINTRISKIGNFVVIAHGSARHAKSTGQSYQEMADRLGVHYLVDGSATLEEDRALITATLIDPRTNEQLWTNEYNRELSAEHIFTIRGDVAQQVALALDVTLSPGQQAELVGQPTENLEAYQEYLLGFYDWEKRTIEGFTDAIRHYERAIALDSAYALAYAGLADVYVLRPYFSAEYSNLEGIALADSIARRALDLDPTLAQPRATLGIAREFQFEWEAAEREFVRAIELDPEYATAHHWYGLLLARLGRHEEALAQVRISLELDPLSPVINQDVGYVLALAGDLEAALRQYERTVELHPDFSTTILLMSVTYLLDGRYDDASDALSRWAELTGNDADLMRQVVDMAARYARTGEPQTPTNLELETVFTPWAVAPLYVLLGQYELALDFVERGYEDGAFGVVSVIFGPEVDALRSHPRFAGLAENVGFAR